MTTQTERIMALADRYAFHIPGSQHSDEARAALRAAMQEQAPEPWLLKTTQDLANGIRRRCFPEVPQFEVLDTLAGVISQIDNMTTDMERKAPVQAREGAAIANSAILARGRFHFFKGENGEPDYWEWFEEGTNCEHGCIDVVIVRADAIAAPQPAQPEQVDWKDQYEKQKRRAEMWIAKYEKDIGPLEKVYPAAHPEQGDLTGCACRWDADDNRVATCVRHQGWLDVVHEWAERAKSAETTLQSAQPEQGPST